MKRITLLMILGLLMIASPLLKAQQVDASTYPGADDKEWGQLLWNLRLANQDLADFTNYQSVDEQGISACRYTIAFSAYFLALEQYHKFPAWQEALQRAIYDRVAKTLVVSTTAKRGAGNTTIQIKGLEPANSYAVVVDGKAQPGINGQSTSRIAFEAGKSHEIRVVQK